MCKYYFIYILPSNNRKFKFEKREIKESIFIVVFQHDELYSYLKMMIEDNFPKTLLNKKSVMVIESNALFLGAAIALSSVFFVNLERADSKELLKMMASLVGIKDVDIWDMANLLFSLAVQE